MRVFIARLRSFFHRSSVVETFDEEKAFHLSELEQLYRERGSSPEEARAAAIREFGNQVSAREELRAQAGFPWAEELANDLRYAWRGILRRPALAISILVILTLGLGSAATIHGLIDAVFLRALPVARPHELYAAVDTDPSRRNRLSRGTVRRLEAELSPRAVAAYHGGGRCTVQLAGQDAIRAKARLVNGSFFAALGLGPEAGRLLSDADDVVGAPAPVVVASFAWARTHFGNPSSAVGQEITVNRTPMTIVGVLPKIFPGIAVGQTTDLWFATAIQPRLRIYGNRSSSDGDDRPNDPDWNREERVAWLNVLIRVPPGSGPLPSPVLQRAWEVERDDAMRALQDPGQREQLKHRSWRLVSAPGGQSYFRESFRSVGLLLGGVVAIMLVLICTNVSGLLLVRSMSRHRELGVRLALGANSLRVVRLGFFEALILSIGGATGGWLIAIWLLPAASRLIAPDQELPVALGLRSLEMMIGLASLTAVFSALAPSLWISRLEPLTALSGNQGIGRAPIRLGRWLVVAQFAIAVTLVAVATTLGGELQRSLSADPGFERDQVMTSTFDPTNAGYDDDKVDSLIQRIRDAARGVPGVKNVAFASSGILTGSQSSSGVFFRDPAARVQQGQYQHETITPGYFDVVGTPLLAGRSFQETDTAKSQRVVVISAAFAREVYGDLNPIGRSFGFDPQPSARDWTIVGVVADARSNGVREKMPALFYMPPGQWGESSFHFLAVRFAGPEAALQQSLRAALARTEPALVFNSWMTLEKRMTDDLSGDLATTRLAAIFGGCALVLAGAGVAGALGYLVALRQRELALRMAIGASPTDLMRSVLFDALRLSAFGGALGLATVWLVPTLPVVEAALHGRPGLGPALFAAVVALVTALVAGWFPARRAARIDPLLMLKSG